MNRSDDLISVLTEEHHELHQLMTELEHLTEPEPLRCSLVGLLIAEKVRHEVAEECYLYPMVRERVPEGPRIANQRLAEHERLDQAMKRLDRSDLTGADFSPLLARLDADARAHMRAEEEEVFPLLAKYLSIEELTALGRTAVEAEEKASVQQYLSGVDCSRLNRTRTLGTSLVERVRAYLRGAYPL